MASAIRILYIALIAYSVAFAGGGLAAADGSPFSLSYSGRLTEANGQPITGPVKIAVTFFRKDADTDLIATSPQVFTVVPLSSGVFQVDLVFSEAEYHSIFNGTDNVWIQCKNMGTGKSYPRQRFNAVPYALKVPIDNATIVYGNDGKLSVGTLPAQANAIHADTATLAATATEALHATSANGFSGALAGDVSGTEGATSVDRVMGKIVETNGASIGNFMVYDGAKWTSAVLLGDVTGARNVTKVEKLQGYAVDPTAPTPGQFLKYDAVTGWTATAIVGSSGGTVTQINAGPGIAIQGGGPITASGTLEIPAGGIVDSMVNASGITTAGKVSGNALTSGTVAGSTAVNSSGQIATTGNFVAKGNATTAGEVRLSDATNANYVALKAPNTAAGTKTFTLPDAYGTSGDYLKSNGAGVLSWGTLSGSGPVTFTPATGVISISGAGGGNPGTMSGADKTTLDGLATNALIDSDFPAAGLMTTSGGGVYNTTADNHVNWDTAYTDTNSATDLNTASKIVKRDASGNFAAGTVTGSLAGNATTATTATNFSGSLVGDVGGTQGATAIGIDKVTSAHILDGTIVNNDINGAAAITDTKLATISTAGKVSGTAITSGTINTSGSFNTSGSVGIGTTAPSAKLHVTGIPAGANDAALEVARFSLSQPGSYARNVMKIPFQLYDAGNNHDRGTMAQITAGQSQGAFAMPDATGQGYGFLAFSTAAANSTTPTERLRISPEGNVGIGTTSPASKLNVMDTISGLTTGLQISPYHVPAVVAGTKLNAYDADGSTIRVLALQSNGGKIGIGTTAPVTLLANTGSNVTDGGTGMSATSIAWQTNAAGYSMGLENLFSGGTANGLLVKTTDTGSGTYIMNAQSAGTSRFVLTGAGNVGIGTTSPSYALDVNGTVRATNFISTSGDSNWGNSALKNINSLSIGTTATGADLLFGNGANRTVQVQSQATAGNNLTIQAGGTTGANLSGGNLVLASGTANGTGSSQIQFQTASGGAPVTSMTILGNGNVGIGTTAPGAKLHIKPGTDTGSETVLRLEGNNTNNNLYHLDIVPNSPAGGDINYQFRVKDAGGLQDVAALTIAGQTGNVGIGTTSPLAQLTVSGNSVNGQFTMPIRKAHEPVPAEPQRMQPAHGETSCRDRAAG